MIKGSWAAPSVNKFLLTLSETNGHVSHAMEENDSSSLVVRKRHNGNQ